MLKEIILKINLIMKRNRMFNIFQMIKMLFNDEYTFK